MKKIILVLLAAGIAATAEAQIIRVVPAQAEEITLAGHFNSVTEAGGATSTAAMAQKTYKASSGQNVLYTRKDTVTNTGTDTLRFKLVGPYNSVYTWCHATSISGTNTSCTAKLYVTGAQSYLTDPVEVYSVTVGSTNPIGKHLFNSGVGWPYTNGFWVFTGVGTHSTSWYGGLHVK